MPCYDSRNEPSYLLREAKRDFRHNSDVAQMLCDILKYKPELIDYTPEIQRWWKEHKERDADRAKPLGNSDDASCTQDQT